MGEACATSEPRLCAYNEHAPITNEGNAVWRVFLKESWRVKLSGMGQVAGIDTGPAKALLMAGGGDQLVIDALLGACELGYLVAMNEKAEVD